MSLSPSKPFAPQPSGGLPPVTLVLGGARSGKSRYAETLVERAGGAALYIATATAGDAEMAARIAAHRSRRGERWRTVEEPLAVPAAVAAAPAGTVVLVDCLTLWLSNLLEAGRDVDGETAALVAALRAPPAPTVLVANEVGQGIVPDNPLARCFRDHAGRINQAIAEIAQSVVLMVAGLPLPLKSPENRSR